MSLTYIFTFASLVTSFAIAQNISFPREPRSTISQIQFSGNGCPQGTARVVLSPGATPWSNGGVFALGNFTVREGGSTVDPRDRNKNCQAHANFVEIAEGWQVGVRSIAVHGTGEFATGAGMTVAGTVFWSSEYASPISQTFTYVNKEDSTKARRATLDVDFTGVTPWSLCGKPDILNVNFRLVMRKGPEDGIAAFGVGVAGGQEAGEPVMEKLDLVWRRCGNSSEAVGDDHSGQKGDQVITGEQVVEADEQAT